MASGGYQETELGVLPAEWEITNVAAIAAIKYGKAKPKNSQGTIPAYGSGGIYGWVPTAIIDVPTIIVGRKGSAGSIYLSKAPCYPSDTTFYLERISREANIDFLFFVLLNNPLSGEHNKTTLPSISRADLETHSFPLPPLPEQQAIARVLRGVQAAREETAAVIAATRELKRSLMAHLFTYGAVSPAQAATLPLQETEIGAVPAGWEVVELGEVVSVKGGKRLTKGHAFSKQTTSHPYLRVVDFSDGTIDFRNLRYLTDADADTLKNYRVSSQNIYISIAGTVGLVGLIPVELDNAFLTENAAKLVLHNDVALDKTFLYYQLSHDKAQTEMERRTAKTSQPKLALARIRTIPVGVPTVVEQHNIAATLEAVDAKLAAEQQREAALAELFRTLLHDLMTGRVRVEL